MHETQVLKTTLLFYRIEEFYFILVSVLLTAIYCAYFYLRSEFNINITNCCICNVLYLITISNKCAYIYLFEQHLAYEFIFNSFRWISRLTMEWILDCYWIEKNHTLPNNIFCLRNFRNYLCFIHNRKIS